MTTMKLAIAIFALALAATACSSRAGSRNERLTEATTVTVDNQSFLDMTVYVSRGQRVRLGIARGHSKTTFAIPHSMLTSATQLRFIADPIGSQRTSISEEIHVTPGDSVGLLIPPG